MRLRVMAIAVLGLGAALSVVAAAAVLQTVHTGEQGAIAAAARRECPSRELPIVDEVQTLPAAAAAAPITMPATGNAGLLPGSRAFAAIQDACPTAPPAPSVTDVAPSPTPAAQATATPLATQPAPPSGNGGDIDAPDIDIPSLPGGGY